MVNKQKNIMIENDFFQPVIIYKETIPIYIQKIVKNCYNANYN